MMEVEVPVPGLRSSTFRPMLRSLLLWLRLPPSGEDPGLEQGLAVMLVLPVVIVALALVTVPSFSATMFWSLNMDLPMDHP